MDHPCSHAQRPASDAAAPAATAVVQQSSRRARHASRLTDAHGLDTADTSDMDDDTKHAAGAPSFFFSAPRLDREASTSSSSSGDELDTPPSTLSSSAHLAAGLAKSAPRAHYRTTDMLQFEGRASPRQVWICSRKPSSPLPGCVSVTPAAEQPQQLQPELRDGPSDTQDCYFAIAGTVHLNAHDDESEGQPHHHPRPSVLHLGHRPTFVHSETVPDVHALREEHDRMHNTHQNHEGNGIQSSEQSKGVSEDTSENTQTRKCAAVAPPGGSSNCNAE